MVLIKIKEHVEYAYTYEEGQKIYDLIAPAMAEGQPVILSFDGISAVPSSFMNAALLQLCDRFSINHIKSFLRIENSNHLLNEMIRRGFQVAQDKVGTN